MTLLQHHVLALALTTATTFGLGLLVFLADPKRRLNQVFGLYSLAISWWAFFEMLVASAILVVIATLTTINLVGRRDQAERRLEISVTNQSSEIMTISRAEFTSTQLAETVAWQWQAD